MPVLVARGENGEKFADERDILDLSDGLAPRMQIAALAERDQLLDDRAQILCLRQRGDDLLVLDERLAHIGKHRLAMFMRAAEAALGVSVIHGALRYFRGRRAKVRPPPFASRSLWTRGKGIIRSVMFLEPLGEFIDIVRRPAGDVHSEVEAHLGQHFLDLIQRFAPEIRCAEHFRFALLNEIPDVDNIVVLQAIRRTHREFELIDLFEERRVEGEFGDRRCRLDPARLLEVDENIELVLQDTRRESDRIFGRQRSVGFHLHGKLVVIEDLPFPRILDPVAYFLDRRVETIDRDQADRRVFRPVAVGHDIALAGVDREFHADFGTFVESTNDKLRIEDRNIAGRADVGGGDLAGTLLFQNYALRAIARHAEGDALDVDYDVGHVLAHAGDRRELVQDTVDMDRGNRRALQRRQ